MNHQLIRLNCRLCGSTELLPSLSLAPTPPANEFVDNRDAQDLFPLDVNQCDNCGHVQLGIVVDPHRLFDNYVYVSGTSPAFVRHFESYAQTMVSRFGLTHDDWIVEIGSNDGTLLNCFKQLGCSNVYGYEPAKEIARTAANSFGVHVVVDFFNTLTASYFPHFASVVDPLSDGKAKLVVANNVFAHVGNLDEIAENVKVILHDDGVFVFEVSYFVDVINKCLFDTIYHEHTSYHTVDPLVGFFAKHGMSLFDVERVDTHGGSIRCYVDKGVRAVENSVAQLRIMEGAMGLVADCAGFYSFNALGGLKTKIGVLKHQLTARVRELKSQGKKIAGYGAPAKATTLMYEFGLGPDEIDYIVDDSPWKQGLLTPGKHVPVVSSQHLVDDKPDYLLILAWNFADVIIAKNRAFSESGGKFIVPVPEFMEC